MDFCEPKVHQDNVEEEGGREGGSERHAWIPPWHNDVVRICHVSCQRNLLVPQGVGDEHLNLLPCAQPHSYNIVRRMKREEWIRP